MRGNHYLPALLLLTTTLFYRKPDTFLYPQFWAEDGAVFFKQSHEMGAGALLNVYAGTTHLIPRLIAGIASFFPVSVAPAIYNFSALGVVLLVAIKILSPRWEFPCKMPLVLSLALVPHSGEIFMNLTNVQWYAALVLIVLVLQEAPRTIWEGAGDLAALTLVGLTGPFILFLGPLFAARWIIQRGRPGYNALLCAWVLALFLLQIHHFRPLIGGHAAWSRDFPIWEGVLGYGWFGTLFFGRMTWIGPKVLCWMILLFPLTVLLAMRLDRRAFEARHYVTVLVLWASAVALMTGALYKFRDDPGTLLPFVNGDRYFFLPRLFTVWCVILLWRSRALGRAVVAPALVLALLSSATLRFQSVRFKDYRWASYAGRMERGERVRIPINPPGWYVDLVP